MNDIIYFLELLLIEKFKEFVQSPWFYISIGICIFIFLFEMIANTELDS